MQKGSKKVKKRFKKVKRSPHTIPYHDLDTVYFDCDSIKIENLFKLNLFYDVI